MKKVEEICSSGLYIDVVVEVVWGEKVIKAKVFSDRFCLTREDEQLGTIEEGGR